MRTDELIVQLARSAKPRRPLPPPGVRVARWCAAAFVVMLGAIVIIGPRQDIGAALARPAFLGSLAVLFLTLVSGASAAFVLSVPGVERSVFQRIVPVVTAAAWSGIWLFVLIAGSSAGRPTRVIHLGCVIQISAGAVVTGWLLMAMIARAAPLRPMWTAAVASLASMAAGAVVAQVLCPADDPTHQMVGHVVIALVVGCMGVLLASPMLRAWRGE